MLGMLALVQIVLDKTLNCYRNSVNMSRFWGVAFSDGPAFNVEFCYHMHDLFVSLLSSKDFKNTKYTAS